MKFEQGNIYHVYNRGNNKQPIFFKNENYLFFLDKVHTYIKPNCDILAWCLMPNHFHFLIHTNERSMLPVKTSPIVVPQLVEGFRLLLSSYSKAINVQEKRTGSLFQQKTKAKEVADSYDGYATTAFHYIHQNPLKAGLVDRLEDWEYSSLKDYSKLRNGKLCNREMAIDKLALNSNTILQDSYGALNDELIKRIF